MVWFSETYVLTKAAGWKYVFGQVGQGSSEMGNRFRLDM